MSYTPTTWNRGDLITAEKFNKVEQGIASVNNNNVVGVRIMCDINTEFSIPVHIIFTTGMVNNNFYGAYATRFYEYYAIGSSSYPCVFVPCLDLDIDGLQSIVLLDVNLAEFDYTGSGGVSSSLVPVRLWDASSWSSVEDYGFLVSGPGTITITEKST